MKTSFLLLLLLLLLLLPLLPYSAPEIAREPCSCWEEEEKTLCLSNCYAQQVQSREHKSQFFAFLVRSAARRVATGEARSSRDMMEAAMALDPDNSNLFHARGMAKKFLGDMGGAMADLRHAVCLLPFHVDAILQLSAMMARVEAKEQDRRLILRALRLASRVQGQDANLLLVIASVLRSLGLHGNSLLLTLRSLRLDPSSLLATQQLACGYRGTIGGARAEELLRRSLLLSPRNLLSMKCLSQVLEENGRRDEACAMVEEILEEEGEEQEVEFLQKRAECMRRSGNFSASAQAYKRMFVLTGAAEHLSNAGSSLLEDGSILEAISAFEEAIARGGAMASAHAGLGYAYAEVGEEEEARRHLRAAVREDPSNAVGWNNLGFFLRSQQEHDASLLAARRAVQLDPLPSYRVNLAETLRMAGDLQGAGEQLTAAVSSDPSLADARALLFLYRRMLCDWRKSEEDAAELAEMLNEQEQRGEKAALFSVQSLIFPLSPNQHNFCARSLAALHLLKASRTGGNIPLLPDVSDRLAPMDRRVGVAYVTSDLQDHAVSSDLEAVWASHDARRLIFFCAWSSGGGSSRPLHPRHPCLTNPAGSVLDLRGMSGRKAAEALARQKVLLIVDLHGWTSGHAMSILSFVPAAACVNFKGFPWSTQASFVDYHVGDRISTPAEHVQHYSEKLLIMPAMYHVNGHARRWKIPPAKMERSQVKFQFASNNMSTFSEGVFILCNFNKQVKLDKETWKTWMKVLRENNKTTLWQIRFEDVETSLKQEAENEGVSSERIIFTEILPKQQELSMKSVCSLFLDSFLYNAHGTAADLLFAQVPLLTVPGSMQQARVASSLLLHPLRSMSELVARDVEDFVQLAGKLIERIEHGSLRRVHHQLHLSSHSSSSGGIFDTASWTEEWERSLRGIGEDVLSWGRRHVIVRG